MTVLPTPSETDDRLSRLKDEVFRAATVRKRKFLRRSAICELSGPLKKGATGSLPASAEQPAAIEVSDRIVGCSALALADKPPVAPETTRELSSPSSRWKTRSSANQECLVRIPFHRRSECVV